MSTDSAFAESAKVAFEAACESGPAWLKERRQQAFSVFAEHGLPSVRQESWRQTNLGPLGKRTLQSAPKVASAGHAFGKDLDVWRLVFVNGHFDAEASDFAGLPDGLRVVPLGQALVDGDRVAEEFLGLIDPRTDHPLIALNSASLSDGAFIEIGHGVKVDKPILLDYRSAANAGDSICHPRNLIVAGRDSALRVVELFSGPDDVAYVVNAVTEVETAAGAEVHHARVQVEGNEATHLGFLASRQAEKSVFRTHAINVGGLLSRQEVNACLGGEFAECTLNGMYLGRNRQLTDTHTIIDHAVPNCTSYQLYKGILDDKARAVFGGRILVREDAQKTDAYQTNRALLLSDWARALTKPQLEIYADDVKCSHGATIGQLNEDQLFYLRARGIPFTEARRMLLHAFTLEALTGAEPAVVQDWGDSLVTELFG